jgi:hypothetical protein
MSGDARRGMSMQGKVLQIKSKLAWPGQARLSMALHVTACCGLSRRGVARQGFISHKGDRL